MFCYVVVPFPPHLEIFSCLRPHKDLRIPPGSHTTRAHHPSHVNFPTLSLVYIRNRYPISSTPLPFIFPISPPIKLNPFLSLSLSHTRTVTLFNVYKYLPKRHTKSHTDTHTNIPLPDQKSTQNHTNTHQIAHTKETYESAHICKIFKAQPRLTLAR